MLNTSLLRRLGNKFKLADKIISYFPEMKCLKCSKEQGTAKDFYYGLCPDCQNDMKINSNDNLFRIEFELNIRIREFYDKCLKRGLKTYLIEKKLIDIIEEATSYEIELRR